MSEGGNAFFGRSRLQKLLNWAWLDPSRNQKAIEINGTFMERVDPIKAWGNSIRESEGSVDSNFHFSKDVKIEFTAKMKNSTPDYRTP
ncbi:hypothetical protein CEXT_332261 [Caerostris extrusa]|uniref:Uncharacterized protein n=1 Tax=Caerostris extrusa TaxID=172846 RepID=A0AAV4RCU3_CAEEX|nr:hypothetical protein CEXT_332261 [Caerostris extrusa]